MVVIRTGNFDWKVYVYSMRMIVAQILGISAVIAFLLSFQFKKRRNILVVNIVSRVLYVLQYVVLGAFEGAVLDFLGMVSSVIAKYKEKQFVRKNWIFFLIVIDAVLIMAGLLFYADIFSLFAIAGVVFEITALWLTNESYIRKLSLVSTPFWFVYNVANHAYGSAVGSFLAMISIIIAMVRYDRKRS